MEHEISPCFYFDIDKYDEDIYTTEFAFIFPRSEGRRHRVSLVVALDKYEEEDICNVFLGLDNNVLHCSGDEISTMLEAGRQFFRYIRVYYDVINTRSMSYPFTYQEVAWALELPLEDKKRSHIEERLAQEFTFIYIVKDRTSGYYKIGQSKHPEHRLKTLRREPTLLPYPLDFYMVRVWRDYPYKEKDLHKQFADKRIRGEWFNLTDEDLHTIDAEVLV